MHWILSNGQRLLQKQIFVQFLPINGIACAIGVLSVPLIRKKLNFDILVQLFSEFIKEIIRETEQSKPRRMLYCLFQWKSFSSFQFLLSSFSKFLAQSGTRVSSRNSQPLQKPFDLRMLNQSSTLKRHSIRQSRWNRWRSARVKIHAAGLAIYSL